MIALGVRKVGKIGGKVGPTNVVVGRTGGTGGTKVVGKVGPKTAVVGGTGGTKVAVVGKVGAKVAVVGKVGAKVAVVGKVGGTKVGLTVPKSGAGMSIK